MNSRKIFDYFALVGSFLAIVDFIYRFILTTNKPALTDLIFLGIFVFLLFRELSGEFESMHPGFVLPKNIWLPLLALAISATILFRQSNEIAMSLVGGLLGFIVFWLIHNLTMRRGFDQGTIFTGAIAGLYLGASNFFSFILFFSLFGSIYGVVRLFATKGRVNVLPCLPFMIIAVILLKTQLYTEIRIYYLNYEKKHRSKL